MPKLLRYIYFGPDPFGHGGEKRSAQISELLAEIGIEWEKIPTSRLKVRNLRSTLKKTADLLQLFNRVYRLSGAKRNLRRFIHTLRIAKIHGGVLKKIKQYKSQVFFWETTKLETSYVIPQIIKNKNTIVAFPHNLESMVYSETSPLSDKPSPYGLFEEINLLKACHFVFAISREETLLLKQCGINAFYLPYFPPKNTYNYLTEIRQRRVAKKTDNHIKRVLMIGSVLNRPTKEGAIDRIRLFSENRNQKIELNIAGFGTEILNEFATDHIKILGPLSSEKLMDTLIHVDAILIHQPATSGALTRIVESLIAGIPVIANFSSARSYFGINGLYVYQSDAEMMDFIQLEKPMPEIPSKPTTEYNLFFDTLKKIHA